MALFKGLLKTLTLFLGIGLSCLHGNTQSQRFTLSDEPQNAGPFGLIQGQMLYLLHRGEANRAFELYLKEAQEQHTHDYRLLQLAAQALLEQGMQTKDAEIHLLCMFGAGTAASSTFFPILEKGVHSGDVRTQLIALSHLGRQQDDEADLICLDALSSPFLISRMEALLQLAKKNHPAVLGHLHSLMVKVPDPIRPVFSQIAIYLEGSEANRFLRSLLSDAVTEVRCETVLTLAEHRRDDFLSSIRTLAHSSSPEQLECCAYAFGKLKDYPSLNRLKELVTSKHEGVKIASAKALYKMGEFDYLEKIEEEALKGSLFAIGILGSLGEGHATLVKLREHTDRDVRLNATLALLKMHDERALSGVREILIDAGQDLGFRRVSSLGGSLKAWKIVSSGSQQTKAYPSLNKESQRLREQILVQCLEFETKEFLHLAGAIVAQREYALIPVLIELLENLKSEEVVGFLKEGQQKAGAPLIRNYCTLALYRLKEEGSYEQQLIDWIKLKGHEELIRFKEEAITSFRDPHDLTPEETSRFLIEVCESLAATQSPAGIEALIHTMTYGNAKNRYALAGLLMRTTE